MEDLSHYNVIDKKLGADLVGGDEEMARELMIMLRESLREHRIEIAKQYREQDMDGLRKAIHKLHGACCYTGTPRLKFVCQEMENALRAGKPQVDDIYRDFAATLDFTEMELKVIN